MIRPWPRSSRAAAARERSASSSGPSRMPARVRASSRSMPARALRLIVARAPDAPGCPVVAGIATEAFPREPTRWAVSRIPLAWARRRSRDPGRRRASILADPAARAQIRLYWSRLRGRVKYPTGGRSPRCGESPRAARSADRASADPNACVDVCLTEPTVTVRMEGGTPRAWARRTRHCHVLPRAEDETG